MGTNTTMLIALASFGCFYTTFYSHGTKGAYVQRCAHSIFPVVCGDSQSELMTSQLMVELFNWTKVTLIMGNITPLTTLMVSAYFCLSDKVCHPVLFITVIITCRHAYRTVMIAFHMLEIRKKSNGRRRGGME